MFPSTASEELFERELRPIVMREVMGQPVTTRCTHCGTEAPANRMPAGQLCHNCQRGVMK